MSEQPKSAATTIQGLPAKSVALLLLAAAVIAGGVAYGVASWQQRGVAELREALTSAQTTIQTINTSMDKLRAENSASLEGLRTETSATLEKMRAENAELRSRLAAADSRAAAAEAAVAKSQQRNPDAIYQAGAEVGRVAGAREDRAASTVTFETIEGGNFDRAKEFEYRDLVLVVKSHQRALTSLTGRGVQTQLTGVEATIVKARAAQ